MANEFLLLMVSYINAAVAFGLGAALVASRRRVRQLERDRIAGSGIEDRLAELHQEVVDWMDRVDAEVENLHERFDFSERALSTMSRYEASAPPE